MNTNRNTPVEKPFQAEFVKSVIDLNDRPQPVLPEIVFGGRSNVGKSSLLNALCSRKALARVSKTPGRTRVINYFRVTTENFDLVDLPGYGYAKAGRSEQATWREAVDHYLAFNHNLHLILSLVDGPVGPTALDIEFIEWISDSNLPFAIILTKCDKANQSELAATLKKLYAIRTGTKTIIQTSTASGSGINRLRSLIREYAASADDR